MTVFDISHILGTQVIGSLPIGLPIYPYLLQPLQLFLSFATYLPTYLPFSPSIYLSPFIPSPHLSLQFFLPPATPSLFSHKLAIHAPLQAYGIYLVMEGVTALENIWSSLAQREGRGGESALLIFPFLFLASWVTSSCWSAGAWLHFARGWLRVSYGDFTHLGKPRTWHCIGVDNAKAKGG